MDRFQEETRGLKALLDELQDVAGFKPGHLLVLGASSSEICGQTIGTASTMAAA